MTLQEDKARLASLLLVSPNDVEEADPLSFTSGDKFSSGNWTPTGDTAAVFAMKFPYKANAESFGTGKVDTTIEYTLYCLLPLPTDEKGRIRYNGQEYEITAAVPRPTEGMGWLDCERTS